MLLSDVDAYFWRLGMKRDPSDRADQILPFQRIEYWERLDPHVVVGLPAIDDRVLDAAFQYVQRLLAEEGVLTIE